ncbi:MAG: CDP-diacylglycerol--glycerol-3-phosphate 3-phosphatidyltransferase [SAR324 cluster bacterium]|nr:CDP-diacylglycerol--glycerol-3-phosphate 3-phosphatidyltransferase [SAR324 cluster bacterium]
MTDFFSRWITPDQMTLLRVLLIPAIYLLILWDSELTLVVAFLFFTIACFTDYWDGVLARHTGKTTDWGKLLDPIADKILITSLLVLLVSLDRAPAYLTVLIIVREFAISGLRSIAAIKGTVIAASSGGKVKTISQMFAVGFLILNYPTLGLPCHEIGIIILWIATAFSIWSGIKYFMAYYETVPAQSPS